MPRDGFNFRSGEAISQQRGIFAVEGHFHSPFRSCEMRGRLRNGTHVLKGGFAAAKPPAKWVFGFENWSFKALGISQPISQLRNEGGAAKWHSCAKGWFRSYENFCPDTPTDSITFRYSHRLYHFSILVRTVFRYSHRFYFFPVLARI